MADPDDQGSTTVRGASQAAILLMALGEEEAANVLRHMEPDEVQSLGEAMGAIKGVSQDEIGATLDGFVGEVRGESSLGLDSAEYFTTTLKRAIGEGKAENVLSNMPDVETGSALDALKWMHPSVVARVLRDEHPQIIATVLCRMSSEQAGDVIGRLPEDIHADLVMRITRLDRIHPAALSELDEIITELFDRDSTVELTGIGGVQSASDLLNAVPKDTEEKILDIIDERDDELGRVLREGMFLFESLEMLSDRNMQNLLREIQSEMLLVALKGASEVFSGKVFKNMSSRAADILRDDLAAKGPVRLSEVEQAQRDIIGIAKRLADEDKIQLGGKGDDFV